MIHNFWDLEVWQRAHAITLRLYIYTKSFPKSEQYSIVDQIRRASSSIGANIAEGFDRYHTKDKQRFYYHARASIGEVQNFILLSKDLQYLEEVASKEMFIELIHIKKLLNGLIRSLK